MIAARQVLATVRSQDELIEALRAARDYRNLSYKFLDEIGGFAMGHMERVLGPRREKGMSHIVFQTLLSMLAVKLELVPDPEQAARMQERWEGRDVRNVRVDSGRISKLLIERAKPVVLKDLASAGGKASGSIRTGSNGTEAMRKVIDARWKKRGRKKTRKARRKRAWYRKTMGERIEARAENREA